MNGYEATKAIRHRECKTGKRIPIIAMTANAMESDRDLCLAAGMDDYISKPFQTDDLRDKLEKWLGGGSCGGAVICDEATNDGSIDDGGNRDGDLESDAIVIDYEKFTKKFNEKQARQLLAVFCTDTEKQLVTLGSLVESRDYDGLAKLAHSIKGAASMIFAEGVAAEARSLEQSAKEEKFDDLALLHKRLGNQFEKLKIYAEKELQLLT